MKGEATLLDLWLKRVRARLGELNRRIHATWLPDSFPSMSACDVIVCCADSDRTDTLDGLAYSRMADGLIEELEKNGVTVQSLALPYSQLAGAMTWARAYTANRFFIICFLGDRLRRLLRCESVYEAKTFDFYAKLFKKTGARSLIGIGLPAAAIRAAKASKVRAVEVLHGYGYSKVPWGWDSAPPQCLPDVVLAFDAVSAKTFRQLHGKGVRVCTIENYWYRKFKNPAEIQRFPQVWRDMSWLPEGRKIVLVSLSWGYDGDHGEYHFFDGLLKNGLFPEQLAEAIGLAGDAYYWVFRLHPVQMAGPRLQRYKRILERVCQEYGNCEWEMGSRVALPILLSHCAAHIAMISMSAYDAAFLGVHSLMLCPTLRAGGVNELMFKDLEQQGILTRGDWDARKIHSWLQAVKKAPGLLSVEVDTAMPDLCELLKR